MSSSLGGVNYSPASCDPKTNHVFNAAAETAAIDEQTKLTPTQKKRKFTLGDVLLGLQNGNFGSLLPGWHDHGSISAIDVNTGRQVWKFTTPEPERGGVTTTDSGLGFAGDGDGVLRAFDPKTGKVLWSFQTGNQIAAGPSLYSVEGKEYLAITVGGTPTSSGGADAAVDAPRRAAGSPGSSRGCRRVRQHPYRGAARRPSLGRGLVECPDRHRASAVERRAGRGGPDLGRRLRDPGGDPP